MSDNPLYELPRSALRDGYHVARVGAREILVVETDAGLRVWDGVCPHLAGPLLDAKISRRKIVCPWHNYVFDTSTGECRTVPGRVYRGVDGDAAASSPMRIALRALRHEEHEETIRIYDA